MTPNRRSPHPPPRLMRRDNPSAPSQLCRVARCASTRDGAHPSGLPGAEHLLSPQIPASSLVSRTVKKCRPRDYRLPGGYLQPALERRTASTRDRQQQMLRQTIETAVRCRRRRWPPRCAIFPRNCACCWPTWPSPPSRDNWRPDRFSSFRAGVEKLITADERVDLFEYTLYRISFCGI